MLGIVKRKANLGVKVNSSSTHASVEKRDTEVATEEVADVSTKRETTSSSSGNAHNSLSLLEAYSDSSDNDSS